MPTAELLRPDRLNQYGTIWERGKPMRVSVQLAETLSNNPRFLVKGLNLEADRVHDIRKPKGAALFQAILSSIDKLDEADPTAWTRDGDPNWRAMGDILGYSVTAQDYARALVYQRGDEVRDATAQDMLPSRLPDPNRGDMTSADVRNPPRRTVRITRRSKSDSARIKDEAARRNAARPATNKVITAPGEAPLTVEQLAEHERALAARQAESLAELSEDPELAHLAEGAEDDTDTPTPAAADEEETAEV